MGEVFSAVLDGDSNVIREYDTNDIDYGIYDAGEKVTFLNGTVDIYNPKKIHELRSKCVDIQNDYFMQVFFISMLAPEFVSIFFGLKPTTADAIKDIGYSSLKTINDVVLFHVQLLSHKGILKRVFHLKRKFLPGLMNCLLTSG